MRVELANRVRKEVKQILKSREPKLIENKSIVVSRGWRIFTHEVKEGFKLFVVLKVHDLTDKYTLEFGWGRYDNEYIPEYKFFKQDVPVEVMLKEFIQQKDICLEIGAIRQPKEKCVPWYYLGEANGLYTIDENGIEGYIPITPIEEAMKNLEGSFVDMTTILEEYIIPTFIKVIERYK